MVVLLFLDQHSITSIVSLASSTSPLGSLVLMTLTACGLLWIYPHTDKWNNCYGDTAIIVGVTQGVYTAVLLSQHTE